MADSHHRALASFVGTTVSVREGARCKNEEQRANDLMRQVRIRVGVQLTFSEALALLRLNISALSQDVKDSLSSQQEEVFECVLAARGDRALNPREE